MLDGYCILAQRDYVTHEYYLRFTVRLCEYTTDQMRTTAKQRLGAFYTPPDVAKLLVEWAVGQTPASVLDPSFGGCSFLKAAADHLESLGVENTDKYVFGVDIDPGASKYLAQLNGLGKKRATGKIENFFSIVSDSLPDAPYHAIVGNPPYLRHHLIHLNSKHYRYGRESHV